MILVKTDLWSKFLSILSNNVNDVTYNTWFKPLELYKLDQENNKIIIKVPMHSYKELLNNKWYDIIENTLFDITGITYEISFISEQDLEEVNNQDDNIEIIEEIQTFRRRLKTN